jgi:hypothetical protein
MKPIICNFQDVASSISKFTNSLELLQQQYFSENEQCFPLTTNHHKPNFSEANRADLVLDHESKLQLQQVFKPLHNSGFGFPSPKYSHSKQS